MTTNYATVRTDKSRPKPHSVTININGQRRTKAFPTKAAATKIPDPTERSSQRRRGVRPGYRAAVLVDGRGAAAASVTTWLAAGS